MKKQYKKAYVAIAAWTIRHDGQYSFFWFVTYVGTWFLIGSLYFPWVFASTNKSRWHNPETEVVEGWGIVIEVLAIGSFIGSFIGIACFLGWYLNRFYNPHPIFLVRRFEGISLRQKMQLLLAFCSLKEDTRRAAWAQLDRIYSFLLAKNKKLCEEYHTNKESLIEQIEQDKERFIESHSDLPGDIPNSEERTRSTDIYLALNKHPEYSLAMESLTLQRYEIMRGAYHGRDVLDRRYTHSDVIGEIEDALESYGSVLHAQPTRKQRKLQVIASMVEDAIEKDDIKDEIIQEMAS